MVDQPVKPATRLQLVALWVAIIACLGAIALELVKVYFGHHPRWTGVLPALIILIVAVTQLQRVRRAGAPQA